MRISSRLDSRCNVANSLNALQSSGCCNSPLSAAFQSIINIFAKTLSRRRCRQLALPPAGQIENHLSVAPGPYNSRSPAAVAEGSLRCAGVYQLRAGGGGTRRAERSADRFRLRPPEYRSGRPVIRGLAAAALWKMIIEYRRVAVRMGRSCRYILKTVPDWLPDTK